MADGDGWTSQLIANLAQHLEDNAIGAWRPDGSTYLDSETAITNRLIPPTPDRLIALAPYVVVSPPRLQDVTVGVQFRIRGTIDPRVCEDIGDAVFELLDSVSNMAFGDIRVVHMYRQSYAPLGRDGNNRWEASHNYYVEAMRRTPQRID